MKEQPSSRCMAGRREVEEGDFGDTQVLPRGRHAILAPMRDASCRRAWRLVPALWWGSRDRGSWGAHRMGRPLPKTRPPYPPQFRAPQGMGLGHPLDECAHLRRDSWAAGSVPPTLPGPAQPEAGAVQRMTVSGWTMATASAQPCHRRESKAQKRRSHGRRRGRAAVRRRTASGWRKAGFSSTKAWWVLTPRSALRSSTW